MFPLKLVPQLLVILSGLPLMLINLTVFMKLFESSPSTTSMCAAHVLRRMNKLPPPWFDSYLPVLY